MRITFRHKGRWYRQVPVKDWRVEDGFLRCRSAFGEMSVNLRGITPKRSRTAVYLKMLSNIVVVLMIVNALWIMFRPGGGLSVISAVAVLIVVFMVGIFLLEDSKNLVDMARYGCFYLPTGVKLYPETQQEAEILNRVANKKEGISDGEGDEKPPEVLEI